MNQNGEDAKGDRDATGRYLPGHRIPGPGRPHGSSRVDFRALAAEHAEAEGLDLGGALWRAISALIREAAKGDVAAAKLLFDRFCGKEAEAFAVDVRTPMTPEERLAAIAALVQKVKQRRADEEKNRQHRRELGTQRKAKGRR